MLCSMNVLYVVCCLKLSSLCKEERGFSTTLHRLLTKYPELRKARVFSSVLSSALRNSSFNFFFQFKSNLPTLSL